MNEHFNKRNSNSQLHIGNMIKEELEKQERTVSWFARKLCCDRSNIYKLFKRPNVDTDLLLKISSILHYNFFDIYKKEVNGIIGHNSVDTLAPPASKE